MKNKNFYVHFNHPVSGTGSDNYFTMNKAFENAYKIEKEGYKITDIYKQLSEHDTESLNKEYLNFKRIRYLSSNKDVLLVRCKQVDINEFEEWQNELDYSFDSGQSVEITFNDIQGFGDKEFEKLCYFISEETANALKNRLIDLVLIYY